MDAEAEVKAKIRAIEQGLRPIQRYLAGDEDAGREPWTREEAIFATKRYNENVTFLLSVAKRWRAEREIWKRRATKGSDFGAKPPNVWSFVDTTDPTPAEITAELGCDEEDS